MHMHWQALCHNCNRLTTWSMALPNIAVLSAMCPNCGWNDLVGWEIDRVCDSCQKMWLADVDRERNTYERGDAWTHSIAGRKLSDGK